MGFFALGAVCFFVGLRLDPQRAWLAYLVGFFYVTSLSLGGLFFVALQYVVKAGWSVNLRRFAEAFASFVPWGLVLGVVLLLGVDEIYSWANEAYVAKDPVLQHKAAYLNKGFFAVRLVVFFGLWVLFARVLTFLDLRQERLKQSEWPRLVRWGVAGVLVFALSYTLFSMDLLMSLEPHWFSTIFGVYCFAGLFQSTMAALVLGVFCAYRCGVLDRSLVSDEHLHDLGKFMFAFTVFWAYIAFSQYMLIWYANLPEETIFYVPRSQASWAWVSLGLLVFRFVVPFLVLLPRGSKRCPLTLGAMSVLVLVMQYVDLYWLAYPSVKAFQKGAVFGVYEVGVALGFVAVFLFAVVGFLKRHALTPQWDPLLQESSTHHVV